MKKLQKSGHLEKATGINEDCFVSPAVITVKKDKSIKIALDSRKLNDVSIKRKAQMPNMEELISRISRRITDGKPIQFGFPNLIWIMLTANWNYPKKQKTYEIFTITGGNFTGYYTIL